MNEPNEGRRKMLTVKQQIDANVAAQLRVEFERGRLAGWKEAAANQGDGK